MKVDINILKILLKKRYLDKLSNMFNQTWSYTYQIWRAKAFLEPQGLNQGQERASVSLHNYSAMS